MAPKIQSTSRGRSGWHFSPERPAFSGMFRASDSNKLSSRRRPSLSRASRRPSSMASRLELDDESLTLGGKLFDGVWHGSYYIYIDIIRHKKTRQQKAFIALGCFPVTHPAELFGVA